MNGKMPKPPTSRAKVAGTVAKVQVMADAEIAEKRIPLFGCRVRLSTTARSSVISSQ